MSLCEIYPRYVSDGCIPASVNVIRKQRTRSESNIDVVNKRSSVPIDSLRVLCTVAVNATVTPSKRPGEWDQWISYIKQHGAKKLYLKQVGLLHKTTGHIIAASKRFTITTTESETISKLFEQPAAESFRCGDCTYVVKSHNDKVVVGFSGGTYMIVGTCHHLYVLALCTSRTKSNEATAFVVKVAEQLSKTKL